MISSGLIAAVVFTVLALLVVLHYLPCIRELQSAITSGTTGSPEFTPPARVILCLRGADPFLDRCLRGLASQDYPNYKVLIVVDSPQDKAMPQVENLLKEYGEARVEVLIRDRLLPYCSRRASSLFCGLSRVPSEVEVIAMCDADAIPHPTWLRELVNPLQDPLTVAASGNRWYAPTILSKGGICRYNWNALAYRAMHRYRIPWCGSLAMRGDLFRDPEFQECLQHAFSEDTALAGFLANKKQHAKPIVSLIMLNEENCGLRNFWGFLVRQMLAARLHHPHWKAILTEALFIFAVMWVLLPLAILKGIIHADWTSLGWWAVGCAIYDLSVLATIGYFEWLVRKLLWERRQQRATPYQWKRVLPAGQGLFLTGLIYPLAVIFTLFIRKHEWRGVVYRIESHGVSTLSEREKFAESDGGQHVSI